MGGGGGLRHEYNAMGRGGGGLMCNYLLKPAEGGGSREVSGGVQGGEGSHGGWLVIVFQGTWPPVDSGDATMRQPASVGEEIQSGHISESPPLCTRSLCHSWACVPPQGLGRGLVGGSGGGWVVRGVGGRVWALPASYSAPPPPKRQRGGGGGAGIQSWLLPGTYPPSLPPTYGLRG